MNKPNSFMYVNLNSIIGKYTIISMVVGNVVIAKATYKVIRKFTNKKKEIDQ